MTPPDFWWRAPNARNGVARLLAPLSHVAGWLTARRVARAPRLRPDVPVISVGNLTLGGGGKTPTVMWLIAWCQARGLRPAVLSRGYGGHAAGPLCVDPARHDAAEVGDEPLVIAALAPTYIARDRVQAATLALADNPDLLILDDGHQNPDLAKDLRLVVVDAPRGFGNGRVAPSGPLREPVTAGLARCDVLIAIGTPADRQRFFSQNEVPATLTISGAEMRPLHTGMIWQGLPVYAFAGIARPSKFFDTLRALGVDLRGEVALSDHQTLDARLMARLDAEARERGARLITTEKDAARLPTAWRREVAVLPVRLDLADDVLADRLSALFPDGATARPDPDESRL